MFRQSIARPLFRVNTLAAKRTFSVAASRMGEGDTGAPRTSPSGHSADAWTDREKSQEAFYVRQKELEKLKALKDKLRKQREHLDELDAHIDELTKNQGGEHN